MITNVPVPVPVPAPGSTVGSGSAARHGRADALRRWFRAHLATSAPATCPATDWAHRWDESWGATRCRACGAAALLDHRR